MNASQIKNLCIRLLKRPQYRPRYKILDAEVNPRKIQTTIGIEMWAYPCSVYDTRTTWLNLNYVVAPGYEEHSALLLKLDHKPKLYKILEIIGNLHFAYLKYLL